MSHILFRLKTSVVQLQNHFYIYKASGKTQEYNSCTYCMQVPLMCARTTHRYRHTHTHTHTHIHTHTHTHTHTYTHTHTHTRSHTQTHTHRHRHRHTLDHTHTYTQNKPGQAQQWSPQQGDCLRFPLCWLWSSDNQDGAWKEAWSWLVERVRKITMEMKMMSAMMLIL